MQAGAAAAAVDTLLITNGGPGALNGPTFSVGYSAATGWLSMVISVLPDGTRQLDLTADATALSASTQTATITITDTNASNSGVTVTVVLTVTAAAGTISVSPATLPFTVVDETVGAAQATTISGSIATPTVGAITYGPGATGWVSSAIITGTGPWTLTVTPTAVGGTVGGPYTATIPVVSAGATNTPFNVTATMTVTAGAAAVLTLARTLDDARAQVGDPSPPNPHTVGIGNAQPGTTLAGPTIQSSGYTGAHSGWASASIVGTTLTVTHTSVPGTTGDSFFNVVIQDANAGNTVTHSSFLNVGAPPAGAILIVSPSNVSLPIIQGATAPATSLAISNAGGGSLGTVSVSFPSGQPTWFTSATVVAGTTINLVFSTAALGLGTHATTLAVAASGATNSPVNVPVQIVVSAAGASNPSGPSIATAPAGWTYDQGLGYWTGSCFNDGVNGYTGSPNGERPTFSGTVYNVPGSFSATQISTMLGNGTIVSGDIIRIAAGTVITEWQLPARPGWTAAVANPFVCIQSDSMGSLPAYSYASGPASYGEPNRGGKNSHLASMPTVRTVTANRSALLFQGSASGYWFEGIDFRNSSLFQSHQAIVYTDPNTGTSLGPRNTLALLPSHLVFDRCRFRSDDLCKNGLEIGSRYTRVTHCTFDFIRQGPVTSSNNHESHGIVIYNTDGHLDILGNQYSAWGISMLIGGAVPAVSNINPSDGMNLWNVVHNDDTIGTQLDSDDCKNAFEHKTGRRWIHAFNDIKYQWYHDQQRQTLFTKAVDPQSSGLFAAFTTDVVYWCNRVLQSGKGFFQASDLLASTGSNTGAGIGSERIECKYNLHQWDSSRIPPRYPLGANQIYALFITKSNGNGIPGCEISNNTFGTKNSFMEMDTAAFGAAWTGVKFENNVHTDRPAFGPIRGNTGTNSPLLDQAYGPGNWTFRRNVTGPSGATWDATLSGGNNLNGYLLAGGLVANFVDPANGDFTLIASHPKKGTGTDGKDPGYDHVYMTAMLQFVVPNTS